MRLSAVPSIGTYHHLRCRSIHEAHHQWDRNLKFADDQINPKLSLSKGGLCHSCGCGWGHKPGGPWNLGRKNQVQKTPETGTKSSDRAPGKATGSESFCLKGQDPFALGSESSASASATLGLKEPHTSKDWRCHERRTQLSGCYREMSQTLVFPNRDLMSLSMPHTFGTSWKKLRSCCNCCHDLNVFKCLQHCLPLPFNSKSLRLLPAHCCLDQDSI